ncbi:MAG TPA: alpha/beta hydrolase [Gemmataceae bacterium]|nr:alpha/beta hydrolase [Gemmataceae bacterium]
MISSTYYNWRTDESGPRPGLSPAAERTSPSKSGIEVRVFLDVPYRANAGERQKLDLYLPEQRDFPVVVFAHGGSWVSGDKALHGHLGCFLAKHGIGAVLVNYQLAPQVRHPVPAQDLSRAFAWTHRHIAGYGGDPERLYLCGHSAGGHSAALLGTDESFLAAEGLGFKHVQGVIAISGLYKIHWNVTLARLGFVFRHSDKTVASPFWNIQTGCPPFLVLLAGKELWTLSRQAFRFHNRLLQHKCRSHLLVAHGEDHSTIIQTASLPTAEHGEAIVKFIHEG